MVDLLIDNRRGFGSGPTHPADWLSVGGVALERPQARLGLRVRRSSAPLAARGGGSLATAPTVRGDVLLHLHRLVAGPSAGAARLPERAVDAGEIGPVLCWRQLSNLAAEAVGGVPRGRIRIFEPRVGADRFSGPGTRISHAPRSTIVGKADLSDVGQSGGYLDQLQANLTSVSFRLMWQIMVGHRQQFWATENTPLHTVHQFRAKLADSWSISINSSRWHKVRAQSRPIPGEFGQCRAAYRRCAQRQVFPLRGRALPRPETTTGDPRRRPCWTTSRLVATPWAACQRLG